MAKNRYSGKGKFNFIAAIISALVFYFFASTIINLLASAVIIGVVGIGILTLVLMLFIGPIFAIALGLILFFLFGASFQSRDLVFYSIDMDIRLNWTYNSSAYEKDKGFYLRI